MPARFLALFCLATISVASNAQQQSKNHLVTTRPDTVEWGYFDGSKPPIITIDSGDTVEVETPLGAAKELESYGSPAGLITSGARALEAGVPEKDRGPGPNILVGPIAINGAQPGDVLEVDILELRPTQNYGINLFGPTQGALTEDLPTAKVRFVPLDKARNVAVFTSGIEIPMHPFFGTMGVASPAWLGRISDSPPDYNGGNLDNKDLVVGTTLYLPIQVLGALFSVGDGHAGQGDGEVDGTAIEIALHGKLRLTVRKDMHLLWPRAETAEYYMTMGFSPDLNRAAVQAVREMVDFLVGERHLSREDAYMLTSMAADLHVTQIVDGTKSIHAMIPKRIFVAK